MASKDKTDQKKRRTKRRTSKIDDNFQRLPAPVAPPAPQDAPARTYESALAAHIDAMHNLTTALNEHSASLVAATAVRKALTYWNIKQVLANHWTNGNMNALRDDEPISSHFMGDAAGFRRFALDIFSWFPGCTCTPVQIAPGILVSQLCYLILDN